MLFFNQLCIIVYCHKHLVYIVNLTYFWILYQILTVYYGYTIRNLIIKYIHCFLLPFYLYNLCLPVVYHNIVCRVSTFFLNIGNTILIFYKGRNVTRRRVPAFQLRDCGFEFRSEIFMTCRSS